MTIKTFYFSQVADLRIEGIGVHASYSVSLNVNDERTSNGRVIHISATGRTNAAKAAGSGKVIFWCKVKIPNSKEKYNLERKRGQSSAIHSDDVFIGSTEINIKSETSPLLKIEIEAGYFYDSGYTGAVPPFPGSIRKVITLTSREWR